MKRCAVPGSSQQFVGRLFGSGLAASSALCVLCILAMAQPALAQDCGSWSRPVLCEAQLVATADAGTDQPFDYRSPYGLAPRNLNVEWDIEIFERRLPG